MSTNAVYTYEYSMDGEHYSKLGESFQAVKGSWTGAKFFLYAGNSKNEESAGCGDFDYVRFQPSI